MNQEKYDKCFEEVFGENTMQPKGMMKFGEGNWNSLAHMELIASMEDTFGILMSTKDITHFGNYEEGRKILAGYGVEF